MLPCVFCPLTLRLSSHLDVSRLTRSRLSPPRGLIWCCSSSPHSLNNFGLAPAALWRKATNESDATCDWSFLTRNQSKVCPCMLCMGDHTFGHRKQLIREVKGHTSLLQLQHENNWLIYDFWMLYWPFEQIVMSYWKGWTFFLKTISVRSTHTIPQYTPPTKSDLRLLRSGSFFASQVFHSSFLVLPLRSLFYLWGFVL